MALLHAQRDAIGPLLLGVTGLSQALALPPVHGWRIWPDELYTFTSAATLAAFAMILWWFARAVPEPGAPRLDPDASTTSVSRASPA